MVNGLFGKFIDMFKHFDNYKHMISLKGIRRVPQREVKNKISVPAGLEYHGIDSMPEDSFLLGKSPVVYMIPHNDAIPSRAMAWYAMRNNKPVRVIGNRNDFTQISNLAEILNLTADIMVESYLSQTPIVPYANFGIELKGKIAGSYSGPGKLVLVTGDFLTSRAKKDIVGSSRYMANLYLDCFIGWNYGDILRANSELEAKLLDFNNRLISDRARSMDELPQKHPVKRVLTDCFYTFKE